MKVEGQFSMFFPNSKRELHKEFPELINIPGFSKLHRAEQLFVWYIGCKASPYYDMDDLNERTRNCVEKAFGEQITRDVKQKYLSGNIPDRLLESIKYMSNFELSARVRSKKMVEKILSNYEILVDVDVKEGKEFENKDGEVDWTKKKAYIDSMKTVTQNLPILIKQAEGSFGVTEEEKEMLPEFGDGNELISFFDKEE